jgi:uncharacterized cupin superfamily protein
MNNIVNLDEIPLKEGEMGSNYQWRASGSLSQAVGAKKLGFHLEDLLPGKYSCPYHFHHAEEELFLVMDGAAMLRQNGKFREVKKGDLIFFQTGPEGAHQFYNHTDKPFRFLALSTMEDLEVCEYPDSGKINVVRVKKIFSAERTLEYLEGEEDPGRFWPKL